MTKRYSEINQHDALYCTARAYPGGIEALAARMGKTPAMLYNKLRPGIASHYVAFEELSEIIEYCQQAQVENAVQAIHALNWRHGLASFALPDLSHLSDVDMAQAICRTIKEFSDVASTVSASLANDGKIDGRELAAIEKEMQELFGAIGELRQRLITSADRVH